MQNLFLFTGENYFSLQEKLKLWKQEFVKKHGEVNLEIFEDIDAGKIGKILTALESEPFLGEKRMVILSDIPNPAPQKTDAAPKTGLDTERIEKALEKISDTTIAVFYSPKPDRRTTLFKALQKKATIMNFPLLYGKELEAWIFQVLRKSGKEITREGLSLLMLKTGGNMCIIGKELEKLSLISENKITEKEISAVVTGIPEGNIWEALETLGGEHKENALRSFEKLFASGQERLMIFFMLVRQIRLLIQARSLLDQHRQASEIQRRLKLSPFQISRIIRQAKCFSLPQLKNIYQALANMDEGFKTGKIPFQEAKSSLFELKMDQLLLQS